jgi:hypothetical protein
LHDWRSNLRAGLQPRTGRCESCIVLHLMAHTEESRRRAYEKQKQRRATWLAANGPCANCGAVDGLEAHHKEPETKVSHNVWTWAIARMTAELDKCIVLCGRCHDNLHSTQRIKHGVARYNKHKCRCQPCKQAKAAENARSIVRKLRSKKFQASLVSTAA